MSSGCGVVLAIVVFGTNEGDKKLMESSFYCNSSIGVSGITVML